MGIQEWFTGEVNTGTVAAKAVGTIRGTRIPYRASGVPYRLTLTEMERRIERIEGEVMEERNS